MKIGYILVCTVLLLLMVSVPTIAANPDLVENPATPLNVSKEKPPGRVVHLKEVFRIDDETEDFYLKHPRNIRVAADDTVYVLDHDNLLKFDKTGKFQTQMVTRGEGPGEAMYISDYHPGIDEITVGTALPCKVIRMDNKGKLIKDFRFTTPNEFVSFITRVGNRYHFFHRQSEKINIKTGVVPAVNALFHFTEEGVITPFPQVFHTKEARAIYKHPNNDSTMIGLREVTRFIYTVARTKYLYVSCSERYMVFLLDLERNKILKRFRRSYRKRKFIHDRNSEEKADSKIGALTQKAFFNDVAGLLASGENVWVLTSTVHKEKGILTDVFDATGKYIDNFYLNHPGINRSDDEVIRSLHLHNGFLYAVEKDEDDTPTIVKYKLNP